MKRKIFAVSDIHGHYTEMKRALDEAGFLKNDDNHLLIVCGDCFDRGEENVKVFEYLNTVQNKILIKGNHEDLLMRIFEKRYIDHSDLYNGVDKTIIDFFGDEIARGNGAIDLAGKESTLSALKNFVNSMYDYYETEHYVFTHGWLPTGFGENAMCYILDDFRCAKPMSWRAARATSWNKMYEQKAMLANKTIVCGHRTARYGIYFDPLRDPLDWGIFFGDGVIAIDALTIQSGRVNVFVTEEECFSPQRHMMKLKKEPFDAIVFGKKRVEMRLYDKKRQMLRIGDTIIFTNEDDPKKTVSARIIGLHRFYNFGVMAWDFDNEILGLPAETKSVGDYMSTFYSENDTWNYGTLAIRFSLI